MILKDICEVYSGYALKDFNETNEGFPVIKIGNICNDGSLELDSCQYSKQPVNEKFYSNQNDIYVALSGATTGKIGMLESSDKYIINQRVGIVRKFDDGIPYDYIKYFLLNKTEKILQDAAGCAQPNISPKQIGQYELPSIKNTDMQYQANILNTISQIINLRKKEIEQLDYLIKARFVELFGDIGTGIYKYETCKLGEVSNIGSSHRVFTTDFVDNGIPFYRGTEISELANGIKPANPYYISEEHYQRLVKDDIRPQYGDLLMPSICNKGQVWRVDTEEPFYYKDGRVLWISPDRTLFDTKFLQYFMKEKTLIEYPKMGSGSTFAEFKIFMLKKLDVIIPPRKIQGQFSAFVDQVDKSKVELQKSLEQTQILFNSLMQKYFG